MFDRKFDVFVMFAMCASGLVAALGLFVLFVVLLTPSARADDTVSMDFKDWTVAASDTVAAVTMTKNADAGLGVSCNTDDGSDVWVLYTKTQYGTDNLVTLTVDGGTPILVVVARHGPTDQGLYLTQLKTSMVQALGMAMIRGRSLEVAAEGMTPITFSLMGMTKAIQLYRATCNAMTEDHQKQGPQLREHSS